MGSVRRAITSLRFSTDGAWLFAGTTSGDVLTINVARKATQLMHSIASAGVAHLQLVPNQAALLAGTLDGSLLLFDQQAALAAGSSGATGSVVAALAQVPGPISSVSVTPGAAGVLLGTQHGDIYKCVASITWRASHAVHRPTADGKRSGQASKRLHTSRSRATSRCPANCPAMHRLALGGRQAPVPLLQSQSGALRDCCWSLRTPGSIATASDDGSVCVWDAQVRVRGTGCTTVARKHAPPLLPGNTSMGDTTSALAAHVPRLHRRWRWRRA
jgi:WD40 repeat protein